MLFKEKEKKKKSKYKGDYSRITFITKGKSRYRLKKED